MSVYTSSYPHAAVACNVAVVAHWKRAGHSTDSLTCGHSADARVGRNEAFKQGSECVCRKGLAESLLTLAHPRVISKATFSPHTGRCAHQGTLCSANVFKYECTKQSA